MIDIHSHILPEIDDGPPNWKISLEMCRIAIDDGVQTMVATPHMLDGMYNVDREVILNKVVELESRLRQENIDLKILPGADTHVDVDFVKLLGQGKLVTINETGKYILVEFPNEVLSRSLDKLLFSIRVAGVIPIITHPERHCEVQRNINNVYRWVESGNLIQITAASITGEMGRQARDCSFKLLKSGLVHLVASDAHSSTWRPPGLSRARAVIAELLSEEIAKEMILERPQMIVNGDDFEVPSPTEFSSRKRKFFFDWKSHLPWRRRIQK